MIAVTVVTTQLLQATVNPTEAIYEETDLMRYG